METLEIENLYFLNNILLVNCYKYSILLLIFYHA
jgi:hypothetical protein